MRLRITIFILFQVLAWTIYFNWESAPDDKVFSARYEKSIQVEEKVTGQFASASAPGSLFRLILRNDGFFTRINFDQSVENGIWSVDHKIPTLILKSAHGNRQYHIIDQSPELLQVELMGSEKYVKAENPAQNETLLYSSVR